MGRRFPSEEAGGGEIRFDPEGGAVSERGDVPDMSLSAIASYVPDFLKRDQYHVYRQLTGMREEFAMHVFTHKREDPLHFPYHEKWMHVLEKPRLRWMRRWWHRSVRAEPWQMYRWEVRRWLLDLARVDAEVLHVYFGHVGPQFLPLMKAWRRPVVVSYHGADAGVDMDKPGHRLAQEEVWRLAAQIQCRSQALLDDLKAMGCPEGKLVIQRTGIPLEEWQPLERSAPSDGSWVICQSGRMIEKKGFDLTLKAFMRVREQWPRARLLCVGDGPLRESLQAQAGEMGLGEVVSFPGFRHGGFLTSDLRAAHVYVHPSRTGVDGNREGVPNALLEAMATEVPCVATRHGGIPEAITDGVSGLLVEENDEEALASAMLGLLADYGAAQELGRRGRVAVVEGFSSEAQRISLVGHYKGLMQKA
jgi:colanic acid/amylovoran biosynthesis glycosyltransferase